MHLQNVSTCGNRSGSVAALKPKRPTSSGGQLRHPSGTWGIGLARRRVAVGIMQLACAQVAAEAALPRPEVQAVGGRVYAGVLLLFETLLHRSWSVLQQSLVESAVLLTTSIGPCKVYLKLGGFELH